MTAPQDSSDKRKRRIAVVLLLVAVIAIGLAQVLATSSSSNESAESVLDVNYTDQNGQVASLTAFEGQPLVVNFFASWCGPCIAEMPDFEDVHQAVSSEVQIVGIAFNDSFDDAAQIVDETGVTYPWGIDEANGEQNEVLLGIAPDSAAMPTTVFIAADGHVLEVHQGALTAQALTASIAEHFGNV